MFELMAIGGLAFMAALFIYIAFKVDRERSHLQLLFFVIGLFFAAMLLTGLAQYSLAAQDQYLVNETTAYTYQNFTEPEAGKWAAHVVNETTTYTYGNRTDYSHQEEWFTSMYMVVLLLIAFVIAYLLLLVLISVFNGLYIKDKGEDDSIEL